jgi:hypothetical protein
MACSPLDEGDRKDRNTVAVVQGIRDLGLEGLRQAEFHLSSSRLCGQASNRALPGTNRVECVHEPCL